MENVFNMDGAELREIRQALGMTQSKFGEILNYHQPQIRISEFERNVNKIPARVVVLALKIKRQLELREQNRELAVMKKEEIKTRDVTSSIPQLSLPPSGFSDQPPRSHFALP